MIKRSIGDLSLSEFQEIFAPERRVRCNHCSETIGTHRIFHETSSFECRVPCRVCGCIMANDFELVSEYKNR